MAPADRNAARVSRRGAPVARRRTLVADADPAIGRFLRRKLPAHGFLVELGASGAAVLSQVAQTRPDTVVVGSDMVDMSALELVRTLHGDAQIPLLMLLTGSDVTAIIAALDAGADDCMSKPFLVGELAARLRKLVRQALAKRNVPAVIRSEGLEIDCVRWRVRLSGEDVALSATEHQLLRMLIEKAGALASAEEVSRCLWKIDRQQSLRLRRLVQRLRRKLGMTPDSATRIQGEPQIGYRLRLPGSFWFMTSANGYRDESAG